VSNLDLIASNSQGYAVKMRARDHIIVADEPLELRGTNTGATPGEMVLASLASCKLITMRMYAERKGWDIGEASVTLRYLEKGEPTLVEKKVRFTGVLDEDQKARLIEISGRCPVAKMLKSSIEFKLM
jgi:putative redox protein